MHRSSAFTAVALAISASFVAATALPSRAAGPMSGIVKQMPVLGVDVTLRYDLQPSEHPGADDDSGPFLKDGIVAITAGPARTKNVFSFASMHLLQPNGPHIVPSGTSDGCGVTGPIAGGTLAGAKYPAIVVNIVLVEKGCLPAAHVFVPSSDTSPTYASVVSFHEAHPIRPFLGMRLVLPHADSSILVKRVRSIVYRGNSASAWPIAVIDGNDPSGKPVTIALDRPAADELPAVGENISVFNAMAGDELPAIRLSADHEARYRVKHPLGKPIATPPPPPVPPVSAPTPVPPPDTEPIATAEPSPTPTRTPHAVV